MLYPNEHISADKKSEEITIEKRTVDFSITVFDAETRKMEGHAAIFGEPTTIGNFFDEQIEPGAFKESIKKDDVKALFNHDENLVLGRSKPKRESVKNTLRLNEDEKGLKVLIDPPDTQSARDLAILISRGDIDQMSFAFQVQEEEWIKGDDKKHDLRKIKKVRLFDVSPVTFPAYEGTDIAMRSYETWKNKQEPSPENMPVIKPWLTLQQRRQLLQRRF